MTILTTPAEFRPVALYSDDALATGSIPVDLSTDTEKMVRRLVVPVKAGDILECTAYSRVTNDTGYTVGVGWHLWQFDVDDGLPWPHGPWTRFAVCGDNVPPQRHHMPLHISAPYRVPADWPEGHRIVIVLQVDAHSTAWKAGDVIKVDDYGNLTVVKWSTPAA